MKKKCVRNFRNKHCVKYAIKKGKKSVLHAILYKRNGVFSILVCFIEYRSEHELQHSLQEDQLFYAKH